MTNKYLQKKQEKLSKNQIIDSTAYIFTAFQKVKDDTEKSRKITQDDYDFTHKGNVDIDADAIYLVLKKYSLVSEELKNNLKSINSFDYFESVIFCNFED